MTIVCVFPESHITRFLILLFLFLQYLVVESSPTPTLHFCTIAIYHLRFGSADAFIGRRIVFCVPDCVRPLVSCLHARVATRKRRTPGRFYFDVPASECATASWRPTRR
jgi:hypothetical protein